MINLRQFLSGASPAVLQNWLRTMSKREAEIVLTSWRELWARPEQLAPVGDWTTWAIDAGRGFGKTRSGAEWIRERVDAGIGRKIGLVARTPRDARKVMIEGESGLLGLWPSWQRPIYNPSLAQVTFWTGATADIYSDEVPDQLRGPQHDTLWIDEFAKFRNPQETWDQAMFGLRLGRQPKVCITTTPRPLKIYEEILRDPSTVRTTGSTFDNINNLAKPFRDYVIRKYKDTRLGRQELYAEHLGEAENALWKRDLLDKFRVRTVPLRDTGVVDAYGEPIMAPYLKRVIVGVDPAITAKEDSDDTGIITVGEGYDGHLYVMSDRTGVYQPLKWASLAIEEYNTHQANLIVGEVNRGGDLVEANIRSAPGGRAVAFKSVRACRGKEIRAEPVSSLYEQGRIHHVGVLAELEDEQCNWVPGEVAWSPNRVDALVWACWELGVKVTDSFAAFEAMRQENAQNQQDQTE